MDEINLKTIAARGCKLKNRRIYLHRLDDGSWGIHTKRLEGREIVETKINYSNDAMEAIIAMWFQLDRVTWAGQQEDGTMIFSHYDWSKDEDLP